MEGKLRDEDDSLEDGMERLSVKCKESKSADWKEVDIRDVTLGEQIGGGGFALVYEGVWKRKRVALKTLFDPRASEDVKKEFMDELFIMSQLNHPNIVSLYGACVRAPNLCMVMELCETSLYNVIHNSRNPPSEKAIVDMATQIAAALAYLHSQSPPIIHRDVKPQNVLISDGMIVKLCDFGLVSTTVTSAGTPSYMAPELLLSKVFSKKVDVYAFGMMFWEMVTGSIPFATWDLRDIRDFVREGKRLQLPLSGCPKQAIKLIDRCWDQDPERRPEFKNIHLALTRILGTMRDVTHVDELDDEFDSFEQLRVSVTKK